MKPTGRLSLHFRVNHSSQLPDCPFLSTGRMASTIGKTGHRPAGEQQDADLGHHPVGLSKRHGYARNGNPTAQGAGRYPGPSVFP